MPSKFKPTLLSPPSNYYSITTILFMGLCGFLTLSARAALAQVHDEVGELLSSGSSITSEHFKETGEMVCPSATCKWFILLLF